MHVATKQHVVGMLTMIRQACHSIEAAIAADDVYEHVKTGKVQKTQDEDSSFLNDKQEEILGQILGLDDEEPAAPKKPESKKKS